MKKICFQLVCLTLAANMFGQTITQKEATELLKKSLNCLKTSDTASFVGLWYLDNAVRPPFNSMFDRQQLEQVFRELQQFLVVPLFRESSFDEIEFEEMPSFFQARYKIKAYFKIDNKLTLGYGFLLDYINGKWAFRGHGETTIRPT
jgi:hypothetical protein